MGSNLSANSPHLLSMEARHGGVWCAHRPRRSPQLLRGCHRDMSSVDCGCFGNHTPIWMFPKMVGFPPKSSILIGFSIINHPFWGIPIFGNIHIGLRYGFPIGVPLGSGHWLMAYIIKIHLHPKFQHFAAFFGSSISPKTSTMRLGTRP